MTTPSPFHRALHAFSISKPSSHPTARDSANMDPALFEDTPAAAREERHKRDAAPLVSTVVVKHSRAFNAERRGGMTAGQQGDIVERLRGWVCDSADVIFVGYTQFKVLVSRKEKACAAALGARFCDASVFTAHLVGWNAELGVVLLAKSEECEGLVDAVEGLWDEMATRMSGVLDGVKVGERVIKVRGGSSATMVAVDEVIEVVK